MVLVKGGAAHRQPTVEAGDKNVSIDEGNAQKTGDEVNRPKAKHGGSDVL
jgi:hypothetical protein